MILPSEINIQIVDKAGDPNPLENVLFGLKIFTSATTYHNYSAFKSNSLGQVKLTRQDIIDHANLKSTMSDTPTRFELYIWAGQLTDDMIKMTKHLLQLYNESDFIIRDLKNHHVAEKDIPRAIEITNNKAIEDRAFYDYIKNAINSSIEPDPQKINDTWNDTSPKSYTFSATIINLGEKSGS